MEEKKEKRVAWKTKMREIRKAKAIELEDPREINYLCNLSFMRKVLKEVIVRRREAGSKLAGHRHSGKDPSKDPEIFFLAKGSMKVHLANRSLDEETFVLEQGYYLIIYRDVSHQFKAEEDIVLLEYRISFFDEKNQDTEYAPAYVFE
jgi:hypothetical protein